MKICKYVGQKFHVVTILMMFLLVTACQSSAKYEDGTYYGESEGYYSMVKVEVIITTGQIESVNIVKHNEPTILADIVFDELPPKIIKNNGTDVDIVSGATYTSNSLIEAVNKALEQASKEEDDDDDEQVKP